MDLYRIVLTLHSINRWLVLLVGLITIGRFLLVWLRNQQNERLDRVLMSAFTGLMDLQVLLGIIVLLVAGAQQGVWPRFRFEHATIMIVAAVVVHLSMRWRKASAPVRARNNIIVIIVAFILIFVGVALLPGGWAR